MKQKTSNHTVLTKKKFNSRVIAPDLNLTIIEILFFIHSYGIGILSSLTPKEHKQNAGTKGLSSLDWTKDNSLSYGLVNVSLHSVCKL